MFDKIKERKIITDDEYNEILRYANESIVNHDNIIKEFSKISKYYTKKIVMGLK